MNTLGVTDGYKFHDALANSWNDNYQRGGFKKRLAFVRELLLPVVIPGQYWLDAGCGAAPRQWAAILPHRRRILGGP